MKTEQTWQKVEPFKGTKHIGCLNCGGTHDVAPMDMVIAVGFGKAEATKDGETVYSEMDVMHRGGEWGDFATVQQIEDMALADPDHDWRASRPQTRPTMGELLTAANSADWQQVVLNGGPPCFHFDADRGRFCLAAERWPGHGTFHPFTNLADMLGNAVYNANLDVIEAGRLLNQHRKG